MDEQRYCIACEHYFPKTAVDCRAPSNMQTSMVTGEQVVAWQAQLSRVMDATGCGRAGKWFVAKTEQGVA